MTHPPGAAGAGVSAERITATWRDEAARLVGALARVTRDLDLAEDLAQDALVAALDQWPRDGVPDRPGAWLMTVAKRRALDHFRRSDREHRKLGLLGTAAPHDEARDPVDTVDFIEDDALRLMFLTAHPALTPESRAALTLRLVAGLSTGEIARGFLAGEATMGQRITRAKATVAQAGIDLDLPSPAERRARVDHVLAVIYLIFNEGYAATAGDQWARPDLCHEAIRLARLLAGLAPDEPETHGLQALCELQASRLPARTGHDGTPVLLEHQDRSLWDEALIRRGLATLARAEQIGAPVGPYTIQAAIAACHAGAARPGDTDWNRIASLYDLLASVAPSPVVDVNRAVAHGRAHGAGAGLAILSAIDPTSPLAGSHLLASVRADLLELGGDHDHAAAWFDRAAALTANEAERALLLSRARECRARART